MTFFGFVVVCVFLVVFLFVANVNYYVESGDSFLLSRVYRVCKRVFQFCVDPIYRVELKTKRGYNKRFKKEAVFLVSAGYTRQEAERKAKKLIEKEKQEHLQIYESL